MSNRVSLYFQQINIPEITSKVMFVSASKVNTSKIMLKILQASLQQYVNQELPEVQAEFRKGRRTRGQIANIHWIIEISREVQENIYFCFVDCAKAFDCVDHNKLWKILKDKIPTFKTQWWDRHMRDIPIFIYVLFSQSMYV